MKLLFLLIPILIQDPDPQDKVRRIEQAIDWLSESDPDLRQAGRKILFESGPEAIPFLEGRITKKGLDAIYEVLQILQARSGPESTRWVEEEELPLEEDFKKALPKVPKRQVDQYIFSKYYEAWSHAKSGNFQRAISVADALLLLEPKSRYRQKIGELRRYCDHRLTQETLCKAQIIPSKRIAIRGEKLECLLQIQNRRQKEIQFNFGAGGQGFAVINQTVRVPALRGDEHQSNQSHQVRFENEIPIAVEAQWEHTFLVDTGSELNISEDLQVITLQGWMLPQKIKLGAGSMTKRIIFEPAEIMVVSKKYEPDLTDPLAGLRRAIDSGTVNDVFVLSHLLEGEQKEVGIGLLIEQLVTAKTTSGTTFLTQLLTFLTGEKLGSRGEKWVKWWNERKNKKESK
ncbi:MAG: hypothetical protein QF645_04880 [Planctomycetota bacterium]|nr:hypothetical protein [Planctomycetota bacterium]